MEESTRTVRDDSLPAGGGSSKADGNTPHSWGGFELRERVGQGGFGEVYRAWDPKLEREVAVKLLIPGRTGRPDAYESVLREARLTARVRHPNVVSVHGVGLYDGRVGFWSDFVRGKTFGSLLAAHGCFAAAETALIGIELCRALGAVHGAGLLHRDIKPGNVMREEGGRILLMDFGLSQEGPDGTFGGTLRYMAPELLAGAPASIATDVYALGALLFELATGACPVVEAEGLRKGMLDLRPDLPPAFARVVETALAFDPKLRYASAAQFLSALSDAAGINSSSVSMPAPKARGARWWTVGSVVVALAAGSAAALRIGSLRGPHAADAHADFVKAQELLERYYEPGNLESSIPLFQKSIAGEPKFAPALAGLGRAYWRRYVDTRDPKYVPLAKDACAKALDLGQDLASVHVTLGMMATEEGKNDLATDEFEHAQRLDGTNPEIYASLAELYRKEGRGAEVEPALQRAIDLDPKDWRWPNQLALYLMSRRPSDAVRLFETAIRLTPRNPRALNNLGVAYKSLERYPEAIAAFEKALDIETDSTYLSNLGSTLQLQGEYPKATAIFRRAVEMNSSNYVAAGNLASSLAWTPGQQQEARSAYGRAIELAEKYQKDRPRDARVVADLGAFYASIGDEAQALPRLRQALALDPENARTLYRVGEGYELLHRRKEALRYIGAALRAGYSLGYIRRDPELAALRSDPQFSAMIREK